ncbi:hypothetical protein BKI52_18970 [marine bacterium AO1-C]|nr:hypothetical protein BKI52_18970 [marine bacterium AO1-C]
MKKQLLILPFFFIFYSCTSFQGFNQGNTPTSSLKQLDGTYKNTPNKIDTVKMINGGIDDHFYQIMARKAKEYYKIKPKSKNKYTFKVQQISAKRLLITFFENNKVLKKYNCKAKVKADGFVYLKNKNFNFLALAFLFGGYSIKKTRLFINTNQQLIVETTLKGIGFVFFTPFNSNHWKARYVFEKID